jgi:hypothetical protein
VLVAEPDTPFRASCRSAYAGVLLAGLACACNGWRAQEVSRQDTPQPAVLGRVRVIQKDSTRVELEGARVVSDTIVGVLSGSDADVVSTRSVAIPLSRVSRAAVREPDLVRTAVLFAVVLAVIIGLVFGLAFREALLLWYDEIADVED